jgi:coproporphyrinogen III oxidase
VQFVKDVARGIIPSWAPIVSRRSALPYSDAHRQWQLLRRGRYLEFNLLYDRGVKFGLEGGRIESIMVSAPPLVAWRYNVQPEAGSEEARLVAALQAPRDWI